MQIGTYAGEAGRHQAGETKRHKVGETNRHNPGETNRQTNQNNAGETGFEPIGFASCVSIFRATRKPEETDGNRLSKKPRTRAATNLVLAAFIF